MNIKTFSIILICFASNTLFAQLDTALYGLTRDDETFEFKLSKMDPYTGEVTNISSAPIGIDFTSWSISAIDSNNEIFYVVSQGSLLGIDMNSGSVIYNNVVSGPVEGQIMLMRFNRTDSTLYCVFRDPSVLADVYLSEIEPSTGTVSFISTSPFNDFSVVVNSMAAIDPVNELYFVYSEFDLYGINMNTGIVEVNFPENSPSFGFTNQINYNCADSAIYFIWNDFSIENFKLYLFKLDPTNGWVYQLTTEPFGSAYMGQFDLGTIDPNNELYYIQSQDSIFGVDINTGDVEVRNFISMPTLETSFNLMNFYPAEYCPPAPVGIGLVDGMLQVDQLAISPNPTLNRLTIQGLPESNYWIDLFDLRGVLVKRLTSKDVTDQQIDLEDIERGVYMLDFNDGSGNSVVRKIIKN